MAANYHGEVKKAMSESVSGKAFPDMHDVTIAVKTFERLDSLRKLLVSVRRYYPSISILVADDSRRPFTREITSQFSHDITLFIF